MHVQFRYSHDDIYTLAGPVLIAVNPCKSVPLYTTDVANQYKGWFIGPLHDGAAPALQHPGVPWRACMRPCSMRCMGGSARRRGHLMWVAWQAAHAHMNVEHSLHAGGARDVSKSTALPPHIYLVAASAFRKMVREQQSQSLIVNGESGEAACCMLRAGRMKPWAHSACPSVKIHPAS